MRLKACPFCGGAVEPRWAPWIDGEECWEVGHVVVDIDLDGGAPVDDAAGQAETKSGRGESVSDAEPDEALKAFEALMTANDIIIRSAFYYILLPSLFAMALPLLLYELLELHDRRRL